MENAPKSKQVNNNLSTFGGLAVEYIKYGHGAQVILAFHGFGRSYEDFEVFLPALADSYTIYAFNNFHHGNSVYPADRIDKNTLRMEEIGALYQHFLNEHQIEKCILVGYSLGGKVALSIAQTLPDRVSELILIAADGIYINKWYKFASHSAFGRWVYRGVMHSPKTFLKFVDFLKWSRLLSQRMHRFIHLNMDTEEKRKQVYNVWMTFRNIDPDIPLIQSYLKEDRYRSLLILGKYDRVIPPRIAKEFAGDIPNIKLTIREAGHVLVDEESGEVIKDWLGG